MPTQAPHYRPGRQTMSNLSILNIQMDTYTIAQTVADVRGEAATLPHLTQRALNDIRRSAALVKRY